MPLGGDHRLQGRRHAGKHDLMDQASVERWLAYRANCNSTAHDYGEGFANDTLKLLPDFLRDVRTLALKIQGVFYTSPCCANS